MNRIDKILTMLVDEKKDIIEVKKKFSAPQVERLSSLLKANKQKSMPSPAPEILWSLDLSALHK